MKANTIARPATGIGALAKATGCKVETIRFYERAGILPPPPRSEGGHRVYDQAHTKRLNFVCRSRALGFSLKEVREILSLVDGGTDTCAEVRTITLAHLDDVRKKIADLRRMESVLADTAAKCNGKDVPGCPIVEVLYDRG